MSTLGSGRKEIGVMGTKRVVIRSEADARDYLASLRGVWDEDRSYLDSLRLEERDGVTYVVESAECYRCGGGGFGNWRPDGGRCYACNGRVTKGLTKSTKLVDYARAERRKRRAAERRAEKRKAEAEAREEYRLERQRDWCEKNGHGRITFEELDAKREAEREAKKTKSDWVGKLKERREFDLTLVFRTGWDTQWGYTCLLKFVDADDNVFVWKTGVGLFDSEGRAAEAGYKVRLKGTVKEHSEYDGVKQTVLTRCKEVEVAEAA
jgi:hypothetical protein